MRTVRAGRTILVSGLISLAVAGCTSGGVGGPDTLVATSSTGVAPAAGGLEIVAQLPPPDTINGAEQPISANDVLEVDVFQVDNLDRTVQVDSQGNISLPLIGSVTAAGKTVRQLEQSIEAAYGANYLQAPDVTIFVKESIGQRITIDGEVTKAGIFPVSSTSTLLDMIALTGGLRAIADPRKIYVYRSYAGRKLVANYDLQAIRKGQGVNPRVYGGDVIVVFSSSTKVAVNNLKEMLGLASGVARVAVLP